MYLFHKRLNKLINYDKNITLCFMTGSDSKYQILTGVKMGSGCIYSSTSQARIPLRHPRSPRGCVAHRRCPGSRAAVPGTGVCHCPLCTGSAGPSTPHPPGERQRLYRKTKSHREGNCKYTERSFRQKSGSFQSKGTRQSDSEKTCTCAQTRT